MKLSVLTASLLLVCGTMFALPVWSQAHKTETQAVPGIGPTPLQKAAMQQEIDRLILQFGDGLAETYERRPALLRFGHLFDQHQNDAVVLFNLEGFGGGNHHAEYIAFFEEIPPQDIAGKKSRPYRLVAVRKLGERGWRSFDFETAQIQQQALVISGMEMGPKDAFCCPSLPLTLRLHVNEFAQIVEIRQQGKGRKPGQ